MKEFWLKHASPYWIPELIFVLSNWIFLGYLRQLNGELTSQFSTENMSLQTATDLLSYQDNIAYKYLCTGIFFVALGIAIPSLSWILNRHSYKETTTKTFISVLIILFGFLNIKMIISTLIALWSPILLAVVIVLGVGGIAMIAMSG